MKKADIKNLHAGVQNYSGLKKSNMPNMPKYRSPLSLKHLAHQAIVNRLGQQKDFGFFHSIAIDPNTPEYSGFNTRSAREIGILKSKKAIAVYTPLIDLKPSDHTTIFTAMVETDYDKCNRSKAHDTALQPTIIQSHD